MLLDEPCNGLDVSVKQEFLGMLREVADEFELLTIYVTHHRDEVLLAADYVVHIRTRSISENRKSLSQRSQGSLRNRHRRKPRGSYHHPR